MPQTSPPSSPDEITSSRPSIEELIETFLQRAANENALSQATQQAYRRDLHSLLNWCRNQSINELEQLDGASIRSFAAAEHRRGLSPRSIQRRLSGLRRFFKLMRQKGHISQDPCEGIKAPKVQRRLPESLDIDQVLALLDIPTDTALGVRDKAMLELFYASGLRVSELASVTWRELNLDEGLIRVLGKGQKERVIPVGRHAIAALLRWRSEQPVDTSHVFTNLTGRPLSVRALQKRVEHWSGRQGLDQKVHPHQLRHSFASHILQSSGDLRAVQELLGHSNLSTTQIYTHLDYQHLAKVYDETHPRAKKK